MSSQSGKRGGIGRVLTAIVGFLGEVMITVGLFVLLFVAWEVWWTDVESNNVQAAAVAELDRTFEKGPVKLDKQGMPASIIPGDAFAVLHIPRFGKDYARPILEGTGREDLKRGLGHYLETVGPGEVGNFAIAGHRTTYGRPMHDIDTIRDGDKIIVQTANKWFVYTVSAHEIVAPTDVAVIAPVPDQPTGTPTKKYLTITSCHPKYSAQQRYIVHALLTGTYDRNQGVPAQDLVVAKAG